MDSLFIKKLDHLTTIQDTILVHTNKIEALINNATGENWIIKGLPFLGVVVGGIITYYAQNVLKKKDIQIAKNNQRSESICDLIAKVSMLPYFFKELAYLEVDSKYQYYIYLSYTEESKKKALKEHYNDYNYIAENKTKIIELVGAINANINKIFRLKNNAVPDNITIVLATFNNHILNLKRHDGFDADFYNPETNELTTEIINEEIDKLFLEYNQQTIYIKNIASSI